MVYRKAAGLVLLVLIICCGGGRRAYSQTPSDTLQDVLDAVFPGTAIITVDGDWVTVDDAVCGSAIWALPSVMRLPVADSQDPTYVPELHALLANVAVIHPAAGDETAEVSREVFPAEIIMRIADPIWDALVSPVWTLHERDFSEPRGSVSMTIRTGEDYHDRQTFRAENGEMLVEIRQNKLAVEHRFAFAFTATNPKTNEVAHIRGAVHNVAISKWKYRPESGDFLALSGLAYRVTDAPVYHVRQMQVDDQTHYTVQIDTEAVLRHNPEGAPVPITITLTLHPVDDNDYHRGNYEISQATLAVNGKILEQYAALEHTHTLVQLTPNDNSLSGVLWFVLGDSCGEFLILDALLLDVPLE